MLSTRGEPTVDVRLAAAAAAFPVSLSAVPTASPAFSPEAQQMCTGMHFACAVRNSERIENYGMHDEATCKPQLWFPDHYGSRPCSAVQNDWPELMQRSEE
jgi:hypothetical protein